MLMLNPVFLYLQPSPSEVTLPDASRTQLPFHQLLYGGTSLALRIIGEYYQIVLNPYVTHFMVVCP